MHGTGSTFMALATGILVVATCARAGAEDECRAVRVVLSDNLTEAWARAGRDLEKQIPAVRAGDCVAMTLSVDPALEGAARLSATSKDGRHAERIVDKPAALGAMALGLVAILPPDQTAEPAESSDSADDTSDADDEAKNSHVASPPVSTSSSAPESAPLVETHPEIWLGGSLGGRIGEPTAVGLLDLEARGDLEVKHWLLLVSLRYGSSIGEQLTPRDASYEEAVLGIGVGRTVPLGKTALELALVPSFASVSMDDDDDGDYGGTRSQLRVGASIRWSVPVDKWWRFTVTADSEVSPRSLTRTVRVDATLPPLPAWTGGLRLGAAGKLL